MKNAKMLLIALVIGSAILNFGCATKGAPRPPEFELYMHNQPRGIAQCTRVGGGTCASIPMSQTDKFFMVSAGSWEKINNYIDALIRAIENGNMQVGVTPDVYFAGTYGEAVALGATVPVAVKDVYTFRKGLRGAKARLLDQR